MEILTLEVLVLQGCRDRRQEAWEVVRSLVLALLLCLPLSAQETTVWVGAAENVTKLTTGLSELELTVDGSRVTGYWRFLPDVEYVIEDGVFKDGVAHWWHRNVGTKGKRFEIKLYFSPDGETALCDYWGRYSDPNDDTRGYIRYSLVRRKK